MRHIDEAFARVASSPAGRPRARRHPARSPSPECRPHRGACQQPGTRPSRPRLSGAATRRRGQCTSTSRCSRGPVIPSARPGCRARKEKE